MIVRKLNSNGIEQFRAWISAARAGADAAPPFEALTDPATSDPLPAEIEVDPGHSFDRRLEFGEYLVEQLSRYGNSDIDTDSGLWTWISLAFIEQLCPIRDGRRKVRSDDFYVLSADYNRRYRHLARTPWMLTCLHGKDARVVLSGEVHQHGEASEQFLSRQQLFTNRSFFAALNQLYVVERGESWRIKTGARAKTGGSMRRLGKVMRQYDLTWDLNGMASEELYAMLPPEFDAFKR